MNQSESQSVFATLCKLSARQLDRIIISGGIPV